MIGVGPNDVIEVMKPKNTKKVVKYWIKIFSRFWRKSKEKEEK